MNRSQIMKVFEEKLDLALGVFFLLTIMLFIFSAISISFTEGFSEICFKSVCWNYLLEMYGFSIWSLSASIISLTLYIAVRRMSQAGIQLYNTSYTALKTDYEIYFKRFDDDSKYFARITFRFYDNFSLIYPYNPSTLQITEGVRKWLNEEFNNESKWLENEPKSYGLMAWLNVVIKHYHISHQLMSYHYKKGPYWFIKITGWGGATVSDGKTKMINPLLFCVVSNCEDFDYDSALISDRDDKDNVIGYFLADWLKDLDRILYELCVFSEQHGDKLNNFRNTGILKLRSIYETLNKITEEALDHHEAFMLFSLKKISVNDSSKELSKMSYNRLFFFAQEVARSKDEYLWTEHLLKTLELLKTQGKGQKN